MWVAARAAFIPWRMKSRLRRNHSVYVYIAQFAMWFWYVAPHTNTLFIHRLTTRDWESVGAAQHIQVDSSCDFSFSIYQTLADSAHPVVLVDLTFQQRSENTIIRRVVVILFKNAIKLCANSELPVPTQTHSQLCNIIVIVIIIWLLFIVVRCTATIHNNNNNNEIKYLVHCSGNVQVQRKRYKWIKECYGASVRERWIDDNETIIDIAAGRQQQHMKSTFHIFARPLLGR